MADDKKNGNGEGCACANCGGQGMRGGMCGCGCRHGGHWPFFLLRVLVTLIILMMVFAFGAAIGRITSNFGYGRYQMMRYGVGLPMMPIRGATSTTVNGGVQNY